MQKTAVWFYSLVDVTSSNTGLVIDTFGENMQIQIAKIVCHGWKCNKFITFILLLWQDLWCSSQPSWSIQINRMHVFTRRTFSTNYSSIFPVCLAIEWLCIPRSTSYWQTQRQFITLVHSYVLSLWHIRLHSCVLPSTTEKLPKFFSHSVLLRVLSAIAICGKKGSPISPNKQQIIFIAGTCGGPCPYLLST